MLVFVIYNSFLADLAAWFVLEHHDCISTQHVKSFTDVFPPYPHPATISSNYDVEFAEGRGAGNSEAALLGKAEDLFKVPAQKVNFN